MIVILSSEWEGKARAAGLARQAFAERRNLPHYGGREMPNERAADNHIVGCRSECAVAKVLRLPWVPNVGILTGVDVAGRIEVRARRMPSHQCDLAFRPERDKDALPYVLTHVWDDRIVLVGWLYGHEARERKPLHQAYKISYIGPPYREIDELVRLFGR